QGQGSRTNYSTVRRSKKRSLMSAMGHQRPKRSKPQHGACPLRSESGHARTHRSMSASCHERTYAAQQLITLLDHLVGTKDKRRRHLKAHRLGDAGIDDQLERRGLLDGQGSGLGTAQDLSELARQLPIDLRKARPVGDQSALLRSLRPLMNG